jgi:hypothetical protein
MFVIGVAMTKVIKMALTDACVILPENVMNEELKYQLISCRYSSLTVAIQPDNSNLNPPPRIPKTLQIP